ncbi:hypothetical protein F2Q69_00056573 [Brassica cretica]|uniref:Uncharacterized protein n=1 Tax=Brassica cretica TaxID=69181 RepID=A0A8S9MZ66_BRACR|nr:hypothetical protein F2Q69_00056573 [Brassica cretica]
MKTNSVNKMRACTSRRLLPGTFTSRCRHNVLSLPWLPIKERTLGASGDDNNTMLINQYNVSEPPPSAQRRNEASFYNSSDSPGPPFSSNQMNSWPRQGSYPTPAPIIQFAHAYAMAPASVSPSPSSGSPHEYSSMFLGLVMI